MKTKTQDDIPVGFTGTIEKPDGTKYWYKEDKLHREDGPAVEYWNGEKQWWINGELHRLDGPAIESLKEVKLWYIEDYYYSPIRLRSLVESSVYLEKQKGKYNLEWLRFLSDQGIVEFPVIPGMEEDEEFKPLFNQIFGVISK